MTFVLLLVCFFLSGFSALLYETAWTREFAFVFGTSELAVVAVLAAYMGGLALGAALAARWAPRIRRPVLVYGLLELAIALWALALPFAIRAVRALYLGWLGGLDALPETLGTATHVFHLVGAFLVLVPCTALMGATLPLLARHAVTRDEQIGPRVGLLYATNTAGAIAGTLAAAFLLLPALGLRHTVYVGAAVNVLVFAAAAALARRTHDALPPTPRPARGLPWILPAIAVSGAVSFGYEVLWFRMLGHLIGGSTAAFSTMLASFLAGIALGSAIASRWARTPAAAATGFALAQLATAAFARLGFAAADQLPEWARALGASVNALGPGALLASAVLLPLTLCIGSTFPFAVRLLARDADEAAASSARVFAWNTTGSIVGAVATGYLLLPGLGLEGTLFAAALTNLALALAATALQRPLPRPLLALTLTALLLASALPTARPEKLVRVSPLGGHYDGELAYFAVGRSSTVALIDGGMSWRLTTNGLPESLIAHEGYPRTVAAARWLSMLPVLARPQTRHLVIIGLGGGMTLGAVPASVEAIDVVELEPEVVAANRAARGREGGDPLDDPRVSLRLSDARGALLLADRRYDAIVSQPSHPWTSGASHLYTREFFSLVRSRLHDDGVFVQWIGGPFVDPPRLRSLLAALNQAFAHVELYRPVGAALVMLASDAPFDIADSARRAIAEGRQEYRDAGVMSPEDVVARLLLDAEGSRRFSAGVPPNSDDFNVLAHTGRPSSKRPGPWLDRVFRPHDPLPGIADRVDLALLARRLGAIDQGDRGRLLAESLDPARAALVLGWTDYASQRPKSARRHFAAALEGDPALADAAIGLALAGGTPPEDAPLPARARTVVAARRSLELARSADAELASWGPGELLHLEASELRVRWRNTLGGEAERAEAEAILAPLIRHRQLPRHLLLRALLAHAGGQERVAWLALDALCDALRQREAPGIASRALALTHSLDGSAPRGVSRCLRRGSAVKAPGQRAVPRALR